MTLACISCANGMQLINMPLLRMRSLDNAKMDDDTGYSVLVVENVLKSESFSKGKYRKYFIKACFSVTQITQKLIQLFMGLKVASRCQTHFTQALID